MNKQITKIIIDKDSKTIKFHYDDDMVNRFVYEVDFLTNLKIEEDLTLEFLNIKKLK